MESNFITKCSFLQCSFLGRKKPEKKKAKANNKKENSKSVSFKESTPISILKKESVDEYGREEADNINLTLESLGKLEQEEDNKKIGSNSISDLQNRFLKKKMVSKVIYFTSTHIRTDLYII